MSGSKGTQVRHCSLHALVCLRRTDFGTITILWSQPVGGLQIRTPEGEWKWVRHIDNALVRNMNRLVTAENLTFCLQVVNSGDMLGIFTGGYYKPTIHRVVQPPKDQRNCDRLSVIYFTYPDNDVRLLPLIESPVLQRVGIERRCPDEDAPLCETWRKERTMAYSDTTHTKKGMERDVEEEVIEGIVVKNYN